MTNEEHIEQLKKLRSFHNGSYGRSINKAIEVLKQESRLKGHWICIDDYHIGKFKCSVCQTEGFPNTVMYEPIWNYCPNCGADMREGEV